MRPDLHRGSVLLIWGHVTCSEICSGLPSQILTALPASELAQIDVALYPEDIAPTSSWLEHILICALRAIDAVHFHLNNPICFHLLPRAFALASKHAKHTLSSIGLPLLQHVLTS